MAKNCVIIPEAEMVICSGRRSPELTLYRGEVAPETGGKVPEAAHMRVELNRLDAMGIDAPDSGRMIDEMRDMHLPEKMAPGHTPHRDPTVFTTLQTGASSFTPPKGFDFPSDFSSNFGDFPFNPTFDSQKILVDNDDNKFTKEYSRDQNGRDYSGNSLDIYEQKPHLYTPDPYEQPDKYTKPEPVKPVPDPYTPTGYQDYEPEPYHPPSSYHEPAPYHPPSSYHEPEPYSPPSSYHEPAPYHPPSSYHEPEPYHPEPEPYHPPTNDYGPPKPEYGAPKPGYGPPEPYKPKGPVMLPHRPYEPKEIKPVTITTHESYTGFDCRKVPYPDRHYADPEAGCSIYHYCHADGKQDTFHCSYGTIFNEYLGTCDHASAVYCGKGGEGYAGPPPHAHHAPEHVPHKVHHHEPAYHHPEPDYGHHASPPHHGFGGPNFNFPAGFGSGF